MGVFSSKTKKSKKDVDIILLGNDSAGKTEVLYSLFLGKKSKPFQP